jgi:hypothetical protein
MPEEYQPKEMLVMTKEALAAFGKDTTAILTADEKLLAAGFTNITHRTFKLPVGPRLVLEDGNHGWTAGHCDGHVWTG